MGRTPPAFANPVIPHSCHPERNFVGGEAADKVESKDPYPASPADIASRHSHQNATRPREKPYITVRTPCHFAAASIAVGVLRLRKNFTS
jgi:hypothetical protein